MSERINEKREVLNKEKATINGLKKKVFDIVDLVGMDEEKVQKRVDAALRSEYGRINGMVNLLAAIVNWPADQGDGSAVGENRRTIEEKLGLDLMLLEDIRTYRGFHTFHTDELEIIDGIEPQYEDYADYVTILLEDMDLTPGRVTIDPTTWSRTEARTKQKVATDIELMKAAVERHKALIENYSN